MGQVIRIEDERYPKLLKEIGGQAPKKLYYKGDWPALSEAEGDEDIFQNCLAVVGSRHLTGYGRRITEQIVTEIAAAGITVVSGFMYGGDEAAHSATVRTGGRTIAVMPCGIDIIHPAEQEKLYNEILEKNGLIISEYEGNFLPQNWSYVQRDRIVAGLSRAIFVTEAALNSGSLLSASYAKKFGRKIFALPGQITSQVSQGTIKLIREGAEAVSCTNDILSFYKVLVNPKKVGLPMSLKIGMSDVPQTLEQKIIEHLKRESMEADTIARTLGVSAAKLGTTLSLMQLKGFISNDSGKYYVN